MMPSAAIRPEATPKPTPTTYPLRRPWRRMMNAAGKVPMARPRPNRLTGKVIQAESLASCWPTSPPSDITMGALAPPSACAAVRTPMFRRVMLWSVMGVFLIRLSGRKYYTHEYIFSYMDMRCSRTIASRSILGSPGGSSTVQGQCEQVLFHLDQLLHAFLNTGEMALDSLP